MCGIFGISKKNINLEDYDKIIKDVDLYVEYNQKRGSDTFGLSFKSTKETNKLSSVIHILIFSIINTC